MDQKRKRRPKDPLPLKPVEPFVTSRAAPPPKDDFEEDALDEAEQYATDQRIEQEREAVRRENKLRRQSGQKPLPLPRKPKSDTSLKARARVTHSESADEDSAEETPDAPDKARRYEGQVVFAEEPFKILSRYAPDDDAVFDDLLQKPKLPRFIPTAPPHPLQTKLETEDDEPVESKPSTFGNEADVKPAIGQAVVPKAELLPTDTKPDITITGDVEEDEDYDDEEVAWRKAQSVSFEVNDSDEEVYSDDEIFEVVQEDTLDVQAKEEMPSQPSNSAYWAVDLERPPFEFSPEQGLIGPLPLDEADPSVAIPASINRFLREYQREGVQFFYNSYRRGVGGILGDDMGLGKTVQVLAFLSAIMRKTGTVADAGRRKNLIRSSGDFLAAQHWPTALIVCPTSLIGNWSRELDTWGYFEYDICKTETWTTTKLSLNGGYLDLILISNELCVKFADELKLLPLSVVIVDEAHRMKNPGGQLSLAVKKLKCRAAFALTGTLMQNRMGEMWSVMDFVRRGWAGTAKQWRDYFVRPIAEGHRHDAAIRAHTLSIMRVGELHRKILPHFYLRRDKRLIAHELPIKRDLIVLCPLGKQQSQVYERVINSTYIQDFILRRHELCDCGSENVRQVCCYQKNDMGDDVRTCILRMFHALGRVANHLALLYQHKDDKPDVRATNARIFRFCIGESYDPARHSSITASQFVYPHRQPDNSDPEFCGKWMLLENLLQDWRSRPEENNKVLLFSNSVRLLKMIAEFIGFSHNLSGSKVELFSGEVNKEERMAMVDRFQDPNSGHWLMLVSTLAGGVGLNLTAANKVVIFDPSWNPANDLQAMDRAFRIGQKRPVDVYRLIGKGTVEENMYQRQIYKQQRARQVNQGTFERRIHSGYEGATEVANQGELFGVHNLFQYNPEGLVAGNLNRIREAELQIRQDNIIADFEREAAESDDEESKEMLRMRMAKAFRMAREGDPVVDNDDDALLNEVLSGGTTGPAKSGDDVLRAMGISALDHEKAFRDSPEERMLYEIGLEFQKSHPELLNIKANDAVRYSRSARPTKRARTVKSERDTEVKDEPWQSRFAAGKSRNTGKTLVKVEDD